MFVVGRGFRLGREGWAKSTNRALKTT